jgi:hypothetical protein
MINQRPSFMIIRVVPSGTRTSKLKLGGIQLALDSGSVSMSRRPQ